MNWNLRKPTEEAVVMSYYCIHYIQGNETSDIGGLLQIFWKIRSTGMSRKDEYCSDDRKALRKAEDSLIKLPDN